MKRVLVTGAAKIRQAGVATIVYAFGSHLDESKVVYDYLMQSGISDEKYRDEIIKKGGRVFELKHTSTNAASKTIRFIRWYSSILKQHKYEILHINCDSAFISAVYLIIAKFCNVKHIIVHAHSTQIDDNNRKRRTIKSFLHYLTMPIVRRADYKMACSVPAAEFMFGKKYISKHPAIIVNNGIEAREYSYNNSVRTRIREEMSLQGKIVIGFVGRLAYQKNPQFLLRVYARLKEKHNEYALVFVGDGELMDELKFTVKEEKIKDVFFTGNRNDVNELLQAFDIFALPSRFEGLGIVYIEAQAAGLPTLSTYQVPNDACITELMYKFKDNANEDDWINKIIEIGDKPIERRNTYESIVASRYDINDVARSLEEFYDHLE